MGVMTAARLMPGPTKIKRGIGLVLLGALLLLVDTALAASDHIAVVVLAITLGFAGIACCWIGLALLLWGLLRD